jgi:protein-L-isoaspartate(D-aspartate) O-methyltransferase
VEGKPGATWMVSAGAVDEQRVGRLVERTNRRLERRSFTKREQACLIRRSGWSRDHRRRVRSRRRRPEWITGGSAAALSARRADEAATDQGIVVRLPCRRVGVGERPLDVDEFVGRGRPRGHARHDSSTMTGPTESELLATLRDEGIQAPRLLEAIRAVPRAEFVPPATADLAYHDAPLRIPHDQVTTQPSLVAKMVDALGLTGTERVLEVGTGYGWQTALLARLAREVWSVERWPDLANTARENLSRNGAANASVVVGDGSEGLPDQAPFDGILVSAAFPSVPEPLTDQLAVGGRLVQPIGPGGAEDVVLFERRRGGLVKRRTLTGARFVRLVGRRGFPT